MSIKFNHIKQINTKDFVLTHYKVKSDEFIIIYYPYEKYTYDQMELILNLFKDMLPDNTNFIFLPDDIKVELADEYTFH